jgi:hypothetical protein
MVSTDSDNKAIQFAKSFWHDKVLVEHEKSVIFEDAWKTTLTEDEKLRMANALERAALSPDTLDYDVLVMLAVNIMRENTMMPDWLASFAADVLEGKLKRPTKRGADKYSNWQRDYSLCRAVHTVANKFNLPKYANNELSAKTTAANIVSEAVDLNVDVVITAYKKFKRMMVEVE